MNFHLSLLVRLFVGPPHSFRKLFFMKQILFKLFALVILNINGCSQPTNNPSGKNSGTKKIHVGGSCEGCEAIYECPVPFEQLSSTATLPDFNEKGPRLEISGVVYQHDGKTPAKDVVIYIYHTDQTGIYTPSANAKGWEKRHGRIRGWAKTDAKGFYRFYTLRPVAYPGRRDPQHIHVTIKEPDKNEYWIDEYLFYDDPLLNRKPGDENRDRGGNGVLQLKEENGLSRGTRNIILGLNVPDYPKTLTAITPGIASLMVMLQAR